MTDYEAPTYFQVTHRTETSLAADDCTEGRLFLNEERLTCGAGEAAEDGVIGAMDDYAGSTMRMLLGGAKDFQTFDRATAGQREATVDVPLSAVTSVDAVAWDLREPAAGNVTDRMAMAGGGIRKGTDDTYGVRVDATTLEGTLVVQLGEGWRNCGSGKERHEALARAIAALASAADGAVASASGAETTTAAVAPGEGSRSDGATAGANVADADTSAEPDWLVDDETRLVARNVTQSEAGARIGCRSGDDQRFVENVALIGQEREVWTDLPEDEPFEIGVVPEHGDSVVREFDGAEAVDGDIAVYLAPTEAEIRVTDSGVLSGSADGSVDAATAAESAKETATGSGTTPTQGGERGDASERRTGNGSSADSTTDDGGSRLKSVGIIVTGLVAWFGAAAVDVLLVSTMSTSMRVDPATVEAVDNAMYLVRVIAGFGGIGVIIYGSYGLIRGGS